MEYIKEDNSEYCSIKNTQEFDKIRMHFYEVTGCSNVFELAAYLRTSPAHISDARRRLQIPLEWFRRALIR